MSESRLAFRRIEIRRMPGFRHAGFSVPELCGGINVVYGPNASGKSTLGDAIRRLLWPTDEAVAEASLFAQVSLDGDEWTLDLDLSRPKCQRGGSPAELPPLAPAEAADRYTLALHTLIGDRSRSLAESILRESAGGYDIAVAAADLECRESASRKGKATDEYDAARERTRQRKEEQRRLAEQFDRLTDLYELRASAAKARDECNLLKEAISHANAVVDLGAARAAAAAFPSELSRLSGQEPDQIGKLRRSLDDVVSAGTAAGEARAKAIAASEASGLNDGDVTADEIAALRLECDRLHGLESRIEQASQERIRSAAEQDAARREIGIEVDDPQLAALNAEALDGLFAVCRRNVALLAQRAACDQEIQRLGASSTSDDLGKLERGEYVLCDWLAARDLDARSDRQRRILLCGCGVLAIVAAAGLGWLVHPSWWFLATVGAAMSLLPWIWPRRADPRRDCERRFNEMGHSAMAAWEPAAVVRRLAEFRDRIAVARDQRIREVRRADAHTTRQSLGDEMRRTDEQLAEMLDAFAAGADFSWLKSLPSRPPESLALFAEALGRWRKARAVVSGRETAWNAVRGESQRLAATIAARLATFGFEGQADHSGLAAGIESLALRRESAANAARELASADKDLAGCATEVARLSTAIDDLYDKIGLPSGDDRTLTEWCRSLSDFHRARDAVRDAQVALEIAAARIKDRDDLLAASPDRLREALVAAGSLAARFDERNREIIEIETQVERAKRAAELETCLADEDQAADALRARRNADLAAVVGQAWVDLLAREHRDSGRPAVFHRAREIFVRISQGRYRLEIDDADGPSFRAIDTSTEVGHALDELSSGTRLQLLLAVRIAFVELHEQGPKLPLILDETLGNSDEARAGEIIQSAIALARDGRQIFYFTAQHDEVAKWRAAIAAAGVESAEIDLARLRGFSELERAPRIDSPPPRRDGVPAPGDLDRADYGRLLDVPGCNPRADVGAVHLWHVIEEPGLLFDQLRHGVNRWGQYRALADHYLADWGESAQQSFRRAATGAKVLATFADAWRIGRGRPVDRAVLVEAKASDAGVTDVFFERLVELATECDGDARALLECVGGLKRYRDAHRLKLGEFLRERGYLDDEPILSIEQIRDRIRIAIDRELREDLITIERVDELIAAAESIPRERVPSLFDVARPIAD